MPLPLLARHRQTRDRKRLVERDQLLRQSGFAQQDARRGYGVGKHLVVARQRPQPFAGRLVEIANGVGLGIRLSPNSFDAPGRSPERPRRREGIDRPTLPPGDFVSEATEVAVMDPTERDRELVAQSHRAGLGEPQMVGVRGASPHITQGCAADLAWRSVVLTGGVKPAGDCDGSASTNLRWALSRRSPKPPASGCQRLSILKNRAATFRGRRSTQS